MTARLHLYPGWELLARRAQRAKNLWRRTKSAKIARQAGTVAMTLLLIENAKSAQWASGMLKKGRPRVCCATRLNGASEATSAKRDIQVSAAANA